MFVLHAAFRDGSLLLWGESSEASNTSHARTKKPVSAWFDAGAAALAGAVRELGLAPGASIREARQAVAWLPSAGGHALPSSGLVSGEGTGSEEAELAPWRVAVLPMSGE